MEQLNDILCSLFSIDSTIRDAATTQLQELEKKEGFGSALCQLFLNPSLQLNNRQLAGIILKQYIHSHWFRGSEKFTEPVVGDTEKSFIRQNILSVLTDSQPKLRITAAMIIVSIAHWDWPQNWPGLVEYLLHTLVTQTQPHIINGVMTTLDMFASGDDLADQHLPPLIQSVIPTLLQLLTDPSKSLNENDRQHALRVVRSIIQWVAIVKQDPEYEQQRGYGAKIQQLMKEWMPRWIEYYLYLLKTVNPDIHSSNSVLITVLETLTLMIQEFPNLIKAQLPVILDLAWQHLQRCLPMFEMYVMNEDLVPDIIERIEEGGTGEVLGLRVLLYKLIDLFLNVVQRQRFRSLLKGRVDEIIFQLISFLQLTARDLHNFTDDPLEYLTNDEDAEEVLGLSLRGIGAATIWELIECAGDCTPLVMAINKRLQSVLLSKQQNIPHWWKMKEAIVYIVTFLHEMLSVSSNNTFDIQSFMRTIVMPDLNPQEANIYLVNAALVFASKYSSLISTHDAVPFLHAAANVIMTHNLPLVIKLSACRCLASLCTTTTKSFMGDVMQGLLPAIVSLLRQCEEADLIPEILKPLVLVLTVDETVTWTHLSDIVSLLLKTWADNSKNPHLTDTLLLSVERLCQLPRCLPLMLQILSPTIIKLLENSTPGFNEIGVHLIQALVVNATWEQLVQSQVIEIVFPKLMTLLLTTPNHSTLEVGVSCLVHFIRIAQHHLVTDWVLDNKLVIVWILEFISRLLSPQFIDTDAITNLGSLISKLILTVGSKLGDVVKQLLQAAIKCLQTTTRSLIVSTMFVVFSHLVIHHPEETVNFLTQIPVQMIVEEDNQQRVVNTTALNFLLRKWTIEHENFHGQYRTKLSIVALSKLFLLSDPRIDQLTVPGDLDVSDSFNSSIRTRICTKSQPQKCSEEPFRVRVFKILVREHSVIVEDEREEEKSASSEEDDDDRNFVFEEDVVNDPRSNSFLNNSSTQIGSGHTLGKSQRNAWMAFLNEELLDDAFDEEDEEDPDIRQDPIWSLNLKDYITKFFLEFEQQNPQLFSNFVSQLSHTDKLHMQNNIFNKSC